MPFTLKCVCHASLCKPYPSTDEHERAQQLPDDKCAHQGNRGQEGWARKPVDNTSNQKARCLLPPKPAPAEHGKPRQVPPSKLQRVESSASPLPNGPQFSFRTCPRTHPCFSIPTATVLAQFHHHLPSLLNGLESYPVCPTPAARGFSPALHLRWLPMASRIKSSYWKPSKSCLPLPQPQRTSSHSPSVHVHHTLLHGLCHVHLLTPTSSLSSSLWLSQAPRHSEPTSAGPPTILSWSLFS